MPFGSCGLCLEISREPVACTKGDIFCRECALTNLLAQRKELKRADKLRREAEEEAAKNRAADDEEEQRRAIRDFELTQVGLEAAGRKQPSSSDAKPNVHTDETTQHNGLKRKFALDEDEVSRIAKEDRAKARKAIDDEKVRKLSKMYHHWIFTKLFSLLTTGYRPPSKHFPRFGRRHSRQM